MSYTRVDYDAYRQHHIHDYTQDKEGVLPVELIIAIALIIIGAGIWISLELKHAQSVREQVAVSIPTTPPSSGWRQRSGMKGEMSNKRRRKRRGKKGFRQMGRKI